MDIAVADFLQEYDVQMSVQIFLVMCDRFCQVGKGKTAGTRKSVYFQGLS